MFHVWTGWATVACLIATLVPSSQVGAAGSNVALGGTATQSSIHQTNVSGPERANDGNLGGNYETDGVAVTGNELGWWEVHLPNAVSMETINVFNRTDCCGERLDGFSVVIFNGNNPVWTSADVASFAPTLSNGVGFISGMTFSVEGAIGDRVRVDKTRSDYLQLAEVQIFASAVPEPRMYALLLAGLGLVCWAGRSRRA